MDITIVRHAESEYNRDGIWAGRADCSLTDKGIKASLRSKNYVNVSEIAMMFGGGGHLRAAGCSNMQGGIEQIKNQILNRVRCYLK